MSPSENFRHPMRWFAFWILLVGGLMDMMDASIVNVALPSIARTLGASDTALEWVASGYLLIFAMSLIAAGRLGDRYGRKRLFLIGVALFGTFSLGAGLAPSPEYLVSMRLLQGLSAGLMMPQLLASVRSLFADKERATAFALYGIIAGLSVAVALILSGMLVDADLFGLSWRPIFLVNVPVALVVLALGLLVIPETRANVPPKIDIAGTLGLALGFGALTFSLIEGRGAGWPGWIFALAGIGLVSLVGYFIVEATRRSGAVEETPVALMRHRAFAVAALVQMLFSASMSGFFFVMTIWLQVGEGFSPLRAGLTAVAFSIGTILVAPILDPLVARGGRQTLALGGLLLALGSALDGVVALWSGSPVNAFLLAPGLVIAGAGLALMIIPLSNIALSAVPAAAAGLASGILSTTQQFGATLGVAILGAVFFSSAPTGNLEPGFLAAAQVAVLGFLICGLLVLLLPRKVVADTYVRQQDSPEQN